MGLSCMNCCYQAYLNPIDSHQLLSSYLWASTRVLCGLSQTHFSLMKRLVASYEQLFAISSLYRGISKSILSTS